MVLKTLKLTNFKNYETLALDFTAPVTAFVGANGMGKTNLLDAIYYLCMTKSYFLASESDVILKGKDFLRIEGEFKDAVTSQVHVVTSHDDLSLHKPDFSQIKIVAKVQPRKKKIFENNGVPYSTLTEHIGLLPIVMLAPDDTELIKDGSEARRRFLDNTLSQLDRVYLRNLITYNKLLEQRNATLKKLADEPRIDHYRLGITRDLSVHDNDLFLLLDIYSEQMLPCANYIFEKRTQLISDFTPVFNKFYNHIAGDDEKIFIKYESCINNSNLKNTWLETRSKDIILHRTTQGIHRDDLIFILNDKPLKRFGSQGQLKSFITALKLAQFEMLKLGMKHEVSGMSYEQHKRQTSDLKPTPILLLDDIFDKFDAVRLKNLLMLLESDTYGQIFLTDTHIERIKDLQNVLSKPIQIFRIDQNFQN